ncbi:MAG: methyltransferase domain-containing protein [Bryobacterales bacterium]|nr:methyltransferase domain-containing protein [Bryobacterales bacterium]
MQLSQVISLFLRPPRGGAGAIYDLLGTNNHLGEQSLYLNMGYWAGVDTYDDACQALARRLGEAAQLSTSDEVLDAGFGFGDQDIFWMENFQPRRICGLNPSPKQAAHAQKRVADRGLSDRIQLRVGSATEIPHAAGSFDKVISLEAAFHFVTRERFFQEAYRVLRPGGRMAIADMMPLEGRPFRAVERIGDYIGRRIWQIPQVNMYGRTPYMEKLRAAGFTSLEWRSIRDVVYAPFARYASQRLNDPAVVARMDPLMRAYWRASTANERAYDPFDYAIVTAEKPR